MKTQFKTLLLLFMAVPLLFISCAKDGIDDKQDAANTTNETNLKTDLVYCGTPLVAPMVNFAQTMSPATVTIGNDGTNLLIKYNLNLTGYYINLPALFVGTEAQLAALPNVTVDSLGSGTVYIKSTNAPFGLPIGPGNYGTFGDYWEHIIPLNTLPECFIVVAYAGIRQISNDPAITYPRIDIWGKSAFKASGYYLNYCVQQCPPPPPPPLGGCETGYAYGNDLANCFLTIPGVTSNNWGWSNGPIGAGSYSWPMYAGAGQCNIGNGTHVGTLTVNYTPPTATVTYSTFSGYSLNVTQLYVGSQILPKDKKGKFTTAPGQFPYKHTNLNGATTDTYSISGLSGPIYVAAHSEVCDAN